ncbi:MAG: trypsin-like peptidase domain-containing protein [Usitatibacter sp.]
MAGRRTHYEVLGVGRDASSIDIASAFRDKLAAMKANPQAPPEALDAVREAYQTLANPMRREDYDETLAPVGSARAPKASPVDDEGAAWWKSALKYAIPVVAIALLTWGWKRHKAPAPNAVVVSSTRFSEASPDARSTPPPEPTRFAASATAPSSSSRSAEQVFADVSASIVRVRSADSSGRPIKQGSGVVIASGRVVTNCHVTSGASQISVTTGGASRGALVDVADEEFDLCSLDVSGLDAPAVRIGTVAGLRTGQRVYAIGAPLGLELTISEGIVSSLREVAGGKVIQTTAPVSPGSSGGGLFDADGKLVGIVTFQTRAGQNLNFAVPADWIAEMRNRAASQRASEPAAESPAVPATEPTAAEMVVGQWWCFGSISGRNAGYDYGADGILRITAADGSVAAGRYRVTGRRILYQGPNGASFGFDIDSITSDRMVQVVGGGERLACERRG